MEWNKLKKSRLLVTWATVVRKAGSWQSIYEFTDLVISKSTVKDKAKLCNQLLDILSLIEFICKSKGIATYVLVPADINS